MKYLFSLILFFSLIFPAFWVEENPQNGEDSPTNSEEETEKNLEKYFENLELPSPEYIYLGESFSLDLTSIENEILTIAPELELSYSWDIFGKESVQGKILDIKLESLWKVQISLNIYGKNPEEEEMRLLYSTTFFPSVYQHVIPFFSENASFETFSKNALESGILLYLVNENDDIESRYDFLFTHFKGVSNYLVLWGEKEFIFTSLTELEAKVDLKEQKQNIIFLSSYNRRFLENMIRLNIIGKNNVKNALILDEYDRIQILKHPDDFFELQSNLLSNGFSSEMIENEEQISPFLFLSSFVNTISKTQLATKDIYILLLIPVLITAAVIFRHIIGIWLLGNLLPVFVSVLCIKFWIIPILLLLGFIFMVNSIIAFIFNRYNLLYTPKSVFIILLNIFIAILAFNLNTLYGFFEMNAYELWYFILFFIIQEKLVNIILSKEFSEYKKSLLWSGVFIVFWYGISLFNPFLVFLFSYPEILLSLLPLNLFIARFTGLRITEYFRFFETIKNIEE